MDAARLTVQDAFIRVATDARLRRAAENRTMSHEIVRRYVAGESISSAMDAASWLEARGRRVSLTHLCSEPHDVARTAKRAKRIRKVIGRLADAGLTHDGFAEVSVRLSALGAALGRHGVDAAREHVLALAETGAESGVPLMLEVESSIPVELTVDVFREVRAAHPATGISLQACRRRTEGDCADFAAEGARVRLTKGAPGREEGSFTRHHDVDKAYVRCVQTLLDGPGDVVVATHDERLLQVAEAVADRNGRDASSVEYQLRYGVRPDKQAEIADRGDRLRVYVPFGEEWYPYLAQRVADSPREILALMRAGAR